MKKTILAVLFVILLAGNTVAAPYKVETFSNVKTNGTSIGKTYSVNKCIVLPAEKVFKTLKLKNDYTGEGYYWVDRGTSVYKNVNYFDFNPLHESINWVNSMGIKCTYTFDKSKKSKTLYTVKIKGVLIPYDYESNGIKYIKWNRIFSKSELTKTGWNFSNLKF